MSMVYPWLAISLFFPSVVPCFLTALGLEKNDVTIVAPTIMGLARTVRFVANGGTAKAFNGISVLLLLLMLLH